MFYHNTKYSFKLRDGSPDNLAGGIIAASAMVRDQLQRRELTEHTYLGHRLFDPQLYLAGLDAARAQAAVVTLASYPWFGATGIDAYDSAQHKTLVNYKKAVGPKLIKSWTRTPVTDLKAIRLAVRGAVSLQMEIGCEGIILPAPLIDNFGRGLVDAATWIDAGIAACRDLRITRPIYATVALCDTILQNIPSRNNPILANVAGELKARREIAGAYVVIETRDGDAYSFEGEDTPRALLVLVDDLVRGAGRQVILNYAGTFGALCRAAGASVWSSGFNLSQRRLKSADLYRKAGGAQFPRYFSLALAGDIGIEEDLQKVAAARMLGKVLHDTEPARPLHEALRKGLGPDRVPAWAYEKSRTTAASAHYNTVMRDLGAALESHDDAGRITFVDSWLDNAAVLADRLRTAGITSSRVTELDHQEIWLRLFREWRKHAKR